MKKSILSVSLMLLASLSASSCQADTVYAFSNPYLYAIRTNGRFLGFFSSLARDSGCIFFFYQTANKFKSRIPIRIYETDGKFPESTSNNDANGEIYVNGDIVIFLAEKGEYSFVQYTNPMTTKITKGWIKSHNIISPFPD